MSANANGGIPQLTVDTLARSIYRETASYGFEMVDIVRLINQLMDLCTRSGVSADAAPHFSPTSSHLCSAATELPIKGERVIIRNFNGASDHRLLEKWLPDKYGRYFVLSCATSQNISIDALVSDRRNRLGIVTTLEGEPIGAMAFLDYSETQRRAELRKLIGEIEYRGQGYAEEATGLWAAFGFQALGLDKIYVSTLQTQIGNIKLNEKIGFVVEGLLKNEVLIDNVRHDVLRMGLSREQFL